MPPTYCSKPKCVSQFNPVATLWDSVTIICILRVRKLRQGELEHSFRGRIAGKPGSQDLSCVAPWPAGGLGVQEVGLREGRCGWTWRSLPSRGAPPSLGAALPLLRALPALAMLPSEAGGDFLLRTHSL